MIQTCNKSSKNFFFRVIQTYIFELSILALHKEETALEYLSSKKKLIQELMELDFSVHPKAGKIVKQKEAKKKILFLVYTRIKKKKFNLFVSTPSL